MKALFAGAALALAALGASAVVHAQAGAGAAAEVGSPASASVQEAAEQPTCSAGPWRFDGLSQEPGERTLFDETWRPRLAEIVRCLDSAELRGACLQVRGQFDDRLFGPEVARAFGTERAAQAVRAESRGSRMRTELLSLGMQPQRLIELPPPLEPSYRGVELSLQLDCVPVAHDLPVLASVPAPPPSPAPEPVHTAPAQAAQDAAPPARTPARNDDRDAPRLHLTGEQGASLFAAHARTVAGAVTRVGVTWLDERWYAGGSIGGVLGNVLAHDVAVETQLSAGYRLLSWVTIGAFGSHRVASNSPLSAWLEQGVAAGIEGSQCVLALWQGGTLCARESFGVGVSWRRAKVDGRQLRVLREQEQDLLWLAGVSVLIRQRL